MGSGLVDRGTISKVALRGATSLGLSERDGASKVALRGTTLRAGLALASRCNGAGDNARPGSMPLEVPGRWPGGAETGPPTLSMPSTFTFRLRCRVGFMASVSGFPPKFWATGSPLASTGVLDAVPSCEGTTESGGDGRELGPKLLSLSPSPDLLGSGVLVSLLLSCLKGLSSRLNGLCSRLNGLVPRRKGLAPRLKGLLSRLTGRLSPVEIEGLPSFVPGSFSRDVLAERGGEGGANRMGFRAGIAGASGNGGAFSSFLAKGEGLSPWLRGAGRAEVRTESLEKWTSRGLTQAFSRTDDVLGRLALAPRTGGGPTRSGAEPLPQTAEVVEKEKVAA